jgi:S-adenosylmethionine hydrolase
VKPSGIVTFTTDFGSTDSYVGQMKGVALSLAPHARLVDLCHGLPPGAIAAGAWVLESGYAAFPAGTVHVAVVDPGVGTDRRATAVRAGDHVFVAPDNGLLGRVLRRERLVAAVELRRSDASDVTTFDGRDLFTPAAARIARGDPFESLGPPLDPPLPAADPKPVLRPGRPTEIPVVHVDRFGNVVLDVERLDLERLLGAPPGPGAALRVVSGASEIGEMRRSYAGAGPGPFLLLNSAGYLEIALDGAPASRALDLRPGSRVTLYPSS